MTGRDDPGPSENFHKIKLSPSSLLRVLTLNIFIFAVTRARDSASYLLIRRPVSTTPIALLHALLQRYPNMDEHYNNHPLSFMRTAEAGHG